MSLQVSKIRPRLVSDQVFEQLRDLIFRGEIKPGERLLPERALSEAFGVSRPTVKSAINKLISMGLVEQHQGQGTFVRSREKRIAANPLREMLNDEPVNLLELLEVRMGLEVTAAGLAAARATPEDIETLSRCVRQMVDHIADDRMGTDEDVNFHMTIAYATKNAAQIYLMKRFSDLLFYSIHENLHQLYRNPDYLQQTLSQHKAILDGIRARDPEQSKEAMTRHIQFVIDFIGSI